MAKKADLEPSYKILYCDIPPNLRFIGYIGENTGFHYVVIQNKSEIIKDSQIDFLTEKMGQFRARICEKSSELSFTTIEELLEFVSNGLKKSVVYRYDDIHYYYYIYV